MPFERGVSVEAGRFERVGSIRCEQSIGGIAVGIELKLRFVEGTVVVRVGPGSSAIGDVGAGEAAVIAAQSAVCVGYLTEPVTVHRLGQPELYGIVVASGLWLEFA